VVAETESVKAVRAAADALDARIVAVESALFNMIATGRGQDQLRTPGQMVEKLSKRTHPRYSKRTHPR